MAALATLIFALHMLGAGVPTAVAAPDAAPPLALAGDRSSVSLTGHLDVLFDPDGSLTLDEVRASDAPFRPVSGSFNASYTRVGAWWLRATLAPQPAAAGPWWLEITAPYTDHIRVYAPDMDAQGQILPMEKETGAIVAPEERELFTYTNAVRLHLLPDQPTTVYLRIWGQRSISADLTLWRPSELMRHLAVSTVFVALGIGAAFIMCIGSLVMAVTLGRSAFAWYGAYVGAVSYVFLGNSGLSRVVLSGVPPDTIILIHNVVGHFSVMSAALMLRAIFGTRQHHRWVNAVLIAIAIFAACCMPVSAAGHYILIAPYVMVCIIALALMAPWLALQQLRRGERAAIWFLMGFGVYAAATIWFALVVLGIAPLTRFMTWGYQTAGFFLMVAVFAGLAAAMQAGARERRRLEVQLLEASRSNERQLEQAVRQRTAALHEEIEARSRAEQALRQALKEQRNFLAMVSHEFRTPLATMRLSVALLREGLEGAAEMLRAERAKIERAVLRMSSLIDTFLADEWLQHSAMIIQRKPVDLPQLVNESAAEHALQAPGRIHVAPMSPLEIEGDAVLLRTAIDNLIGNAVKHTQGAVRVSLEGRPEDALIVVEDEGAGIAAQERAEIFARFYRSAAAMNRPGTGLGLHLSQMIAERHGGTISVGDAGGGGSRFELCLPRGLAGAPPTTAAAMARTV